MIFISKKAAEDAVKGYFKALVDRGVMGVDAIDGACEMIRLLNQLPQFRMGTEEKTESGLLDE